MHRGIVLCCGETSVKFETVLYAAAFLTLALISLPNEENQSETSASSAAISVIQPQETLAFHQRQEAPDAESESDTESTDTPE